MEQIPNYKPLSQRLQEEREYFEKLYAKLQEYLSDRQMEQLKHYLKTYNALVDAAKEISYCNPYILNQITHAKKSVIEDMNKLLGIDFTDEEKEEILYVFDIPIINDGQITW